MKSIETQTEEVASGSKTSGVKRKIVRFKDFASEEDFIKAAEDVYDEGKELRQIFGFSMEEESPSEDDNLMSELLALCTWAEKRKQRWPESFYEGEEDPLVFSPNRVISINISTTTIVKPSCSKLNLSSLRISSRQNSSETKDRRENVKKDAPKRVIKRGARIKSPTKKLTDEEKILEDAYRGVLEFDGNQSQGSASPSLDSGDSQSPTKENDPWADVEF
ncbi:unnamed protein product [Caenorhabditis auriculariae]|uniref:Uncharacterized protein n=1 Tax=Caenorhabditis auriculariae TaxID=2777116 RepID=A0A8S1HTZ7_9PELO|nr:unnamed protein product [Caenorhabditis auriculariae]